MATPTSSLPPIVTRTLAVAAAALALCWAALLNGQPFFHPDTLGYVRGPDVAIMKLLGPSFASPWARLDPGAAVVAGEARSGSARAPHGYDDKEVLAGRSIYYGVLADLGARSGGFWLTVFIQALAVAWLAEIVLRGLRITGLGAYAAVMAALALATPAPFFVGFLMPDIWAGLAIGALAALFAFPSRLTRLDIAVLSLITAFAGLAHSSVAPVILAMILGAGLIRLFKPCAFRPVLGFAVGRMALAVALAGALVFSAMVRHTVGAPPVTPPFLTARLVADGTGTRFIKQHCADQTFEVCRYARRLPMDVDHFLWGVSAKDGVFQTVGPAQRRALGDEQVRFALAVARAYPLDQAAASLRNAAAQMSATDLSDFNYKPSLQASFAATLPQQTRAVMRRTLAQRQAWPLAELWSLQTGVLALLMIAMGLATLRRPRPGPTSSDANTAAGRLMVMVLLGVAANGAVCGVLSTLYGRYQARAIWLVPLAALAWVITRLQAAQAVAGPSRPGLFTSADRA